MLRITNWRIHAVASFSMILWKHAWNLNHHDYGFLYHLSRSRSPPPTQFWVSCPECWDHREFYSSQAIFGNRTATWGSAGPTCWSLCVIYLVPQIVNQALNSDQTIVPTISCQQCLQQLIRRDFLQSLYLRKPSLAHLRSTLAKHTWQRRSCGVRRSQLCTSCDRRKAYL